MRISARQWRLVKQYIKRDGAHPDNAAQMAGVPVDEARARLAREATVDGQPAGESPPASSSESQQARP